jgi:hypothetical protein
VDHFCIPLIGVVDIGPVGVVTVVRTGSTPLPANSQPERRHFLRVLSRTTGADPAVGPGFRGAIVRIS